MKKGSGEFFRCAECIMSGYIQSLYDSVMKLILSIEWYDLVDIAVVAFAFYYCIKLVRQTRAFHLFKGIVFLGVAYVIVSALNMSAASYLFSHLFGDIVIVMILLFQPEIRHVIESFGRGDFRKLALFWNRGSDYSSDEMRSSASNLSKAIANMSDKKIGALIVLEGQSYLSDIINTGSAVDAAITTTVVENIFFPKAPLHDGAVIIRDNRIHAAGCILPLTQSEISKELGTRHRAALGMSENSDALVLVVSEETGYISVAKDGKLTRNLTLGELLEIITDFLVTEDDEKKDRKRRRKK